MNIIEKGGDYTKKEIYTLSKSPRAEKMSSHVGEIIQVDKYLIYEDGENRDTPFQILSVQSGKLIDRLDVTRSLEGICLLAVNMAERIKKTSCRNMLLQLLCIHAFYSSNSETPLVSLD